MIQLLKQHICIIAQDGVNQGHSVKWQKFRSIWEWNKEIPGIISELLISYKNKVCHILHDHIDLEIFQIAGEREDKLLFRICEERDDDNNVYPWLVQIRMERNDHLHSSYNTTTITTDVRYTESVWKRNKINISNYKSLQHFHDFVDFLVTKLE